MSFTLQPGKSFKNINQIILPPWFILLKTFQYNLNSLPWLCQGLLVLHNLFQPLCSPSAPSTFSCSLLLSHTGLLPSLADANSAVGDTLGLDALCTYCLQCRSSAFHRTTFLVLQLKHYLLRQTLPVPIFKISPFIAIYYNSRLCPPALFPLWRLSKAIAIWSFIYWRSAPT